ncbi:MAG TPA: hypothetical protein VMD76_13160 [Candidatus Sulfotelmatobacter sp.]|jgi:hypothetical protein|nr:hypothetical protein [Candidatus Sulfotelmatobacter sp.]
MDYRDEREEYVKPPAPAYPAIHIAQPIPVEKRSGFSARLEAGIGGFIFIAGAGWALYQSIVNGASPWQLQYWPPSPVEICVLGLLGWLHAKWRHAERVS